MINNTTKNTYQTLDAETVAGRSKRKVQEEGGARWTFLPTRLRAAAWLVRGRRSCDKGEERACGGSTSSRRCVRRRRQRRMARVRVWCFSVQSSGCVCFRGRKHVQQQTELRVGYLVVSTINDFKGTQVCKFSLYKQ